MLSDTWARVRHSDADHPVFFLPCADPYLPLRRVCHRLDRITDQVDHNLLYLHLVDQYQRCASVEIEMGPNALLLRTDQRSEEHTSELQSLMRISYAVFG